MKRFKQWFLLSIFVVTVVWVGVVSAHQPWFEDFDFTQAQPYIVRDATVSTAIYSTLTPGDRDYFSFEATAAQTILLAITIPKIDGLADFAPTMRVFGPGLNAGGYEIPPTPATEFYEPFSGTTYWDRQEEYVTFTEGGTYTVEVLHPAGTAGRYVFVIGTRETGGGDPAFSSKMRAYWTPLQIAEPTPEPQPTDPPPTTPPLVVTQPPTATPDPTPEPATESSDTSYGPRPTGLCDDH